MTETCKRWGPPSCGSAALPCSGAGPGAHCQAFLAEGDQPRGQVHTALNAHSGAWTDIPDLKGSSVCRLLLMC